jgi:hypothetical protein
MNDRRRRCHVEVKGGVTSEGVLTGAMDQTANCCPRQRNTPIQTQPRVMKPARRSQIPKPTPMSAIVIKAKICHRRLTSTLTNYRSSESARAGSCHHDHTTGSSPVASRFSIVEFGQPWDRGESFVGFGRRPEFHLDKVASKTGHSPLSWSHVQGEAVDIL